MDHLGKRHLSVFLLAAAINAKDIYAEIKAENAASRSIVELARSIGATQDIADSIEKVLEPQVLAGSCQKHFARLEPTTDKLSAHDRSNPVAIRDMVRCGKWLFFSANFASKMAIPENILKALPEVFPNQLGPAFTQTGLYENPYEPGLPLGFVKLEKSPWGILGLATGPARGISCATCHFGQMPDGRFAAGMPNQKLDFGKVNAMLMYSAWRADYKQKDTSIWPEQLQEFYRDLDKELEKSRSPSRFLLDVGKAVGWLHASDSFYAFTGASRPLYDEAASWLSGTPNQYYASSPLLPVAGKTYWLSAPTTWDLQHYPGEFTEGSSRPLSSFSPVKSAEDFIGLAFIFQTGLKTYAQSRYVDPLVLYFRTLRTPVPLQRPDQTLVSKGQTVFAAKCASCHNGLDGESLQAYPASTVNTPEVLVDPLLQYQAPKALSKSIFEQTVAVIGYEPLTNQGVYSRKLKGIYARRQIMLNGSVRDLDDAFCLSGPRSNSLPEWDGLRTDVHIDLCQLAENEKLALKARLLDWY